MQFDLFAFWDNGFFHGSWIETWQISGLVDWLYDSNLEVACFYLHHGQNAFLDVHNLKDISHVVIFWWARSVELVSFISKSPFSYWLGCPMAYPFCKLHTCCVHGMFPRSLLIGLNTLCRAWGGSTKYLWNNQDYLEMATSLGGGYKKSFYENSMAYLPKLEVILPLRRNIRFSHGIK